MSPNTTVSEIYSLPFRGTLSYTAHMNSCCFFLPHKENFLLITVCMIVHMQNRNILEGRDVLFSLKHIWKWERQSGRRLGITRLCRHHVRQILSYRDKALSLKGVTRLACWSYSSIWKNVTGLETFSLIFWSNWFNANFYPVVLAQRMAQLDLLFLLLQVFTYTIPRRAALQPLGLHFASWLSQLQLL